MTRRSRRISAAISALVATVAFVTACGSPGTAPSGGPSAQGAPDATHTSYPLTITQPDGTTAVVKQKPTRIVTVNNPSYAVEYLVAIGAEPIAGETYPAGSGDLGGYDARGVPTVVSGQVPSFKSVGTVTSAHDLEAIAALQPDLIVGSNGKTDKDTPLQKIAPFVSIYPDVPVGPGIQSQSWYPEMAQLAQVLDRQAEFDAFISKFEAAASAVRPALTGKSVQLVSAQGQDLYIPGPRRFPAPVLTYLGMTVPPAPAGGSYLSGANPDDGLVQLSLERVGELTGDYLMFEATVGGAAAQQAFLASPVVQQLPAVKAGRVVTSGEGTPVGDINGGPIDILTGIPNYPKAFGQPG